jgi:two-component system OmpR family response regulator
MTQENANKKILVVDDDPDFLMQHEALLKRAGYQVVTAPGKTEAVTMLDEVRPDLAVVDVMMENADDGFTLCHHIKKQMPQTPVVMVTSVNDETRHGFTTSLEEHREWIKADAFLAKPIRFEQLTRELDRLLGVTH